MQTPCFRSCNNYQQENPHGEGGGWVSRPSIYYPIAQLQDEDGTIYAQGVLHRTYT
jgi:hypothetical protein